jgi:hypothetical protein
VRGRLPHCPRAVGAMPKKVAGAPALSAKGTSKGPGKKSGKPLATPPSRDSSKSPDLSRTPRSQEGEATEEVQESVESLQQQIYELQQGMAVAAATAAEELLAAQSANQDLQQQALAARADLSRLQAQLEEAQQQASRDGSPTSPTEAATADTDAANDASATSAPTSSLVSHARTGAELESMVKALEYENARLRAAGGAEAMGGVGSKLWELEERLAMLTIEKKALEDEVTAHSGPPQP